MENSFSRQITSLPLGFTVRNWIKQVFDLTDGYEMMQRLEVA